MSGKKRIIIILTVLVGFALLVMLLTRSGSGTKSTSKSKPVVKPISVTDYANRDSKVVFTVDGRINGDNEHRAIRISVNRGFRTVEVIKGYENNVIKTQTDVNNPAAYTNFVYAISRYNFAKERKTTQPDERGACSLGNRYIYEIYDNNDLVMHRWTTSCDSMGTSAASFSQINNLFQKQITDYNKFTSDVQL